MVLDPNNPNDWDAKRLEFERYKLRLEYKKFLWGSVVAAIAIAAIPPAFQAGTALIEYVKSMAQLQNDQLVFRQRHISDFVARAVDRDIEPRIRLAEYFASVSGKEFREGWREYWVELQKQRDKNWQLLDDLEERWVKMPSKPSGIEEVDQRNIIEIEAIDRQRKRLNRQIGNVEVDRVRPSESPSSPGAHAPAPSVPAAASLPDVSGGSVDPSRYVVFVQFAGGITREAVIAMGRVLAVAGWRMAGADAGGERTAKASGYNEVRYGPEADKAAAETLARQVQITAPISAISDVKATRTPGILGNRLEVWISR